MKRRRRPRYVVTAIRDGADVFDWIAVVGPFRSRGRAERRAATIRRLAEEYEDPEGVTGPGNALYVCVEVLLPGAASAQHVMDVLYRSVDPEWVEPVAELPRG